MVQVTIRRHDLRRVSQWAKELRARQLLAGTSKGELVFQDPESKKSIKIGKEANNANQRVK